MRSKAPGRELPVRGLFFMRFDLGTKQQRSSRGIPGSFCYLLLITVKQAKLLCKGNARGINGISHNACFCPKSSVVRFEIIIIVTFRVAHNFKLHILALHHNNGKLKDAAFNVSVYPATLTLFSTLPSVDAPARALLV